MSSRLSVALALCVGLAWAGCSATAGANQQLSRCSGDHLAFQLPDVSPPQQTQAVGLAVYNVGAPCRLELRVSLTLAHADGRPLRVRGGTSRLTLVAARLRAGTRAWAIWTYRNYCGADNKRTGPKVLETFRVGATELRAHGGGTPCYRPDRPVLLSLFAACPSAKGPAVDALTPGEKRFALACR